MDDKMVELAKSVTREAGEYLKNGLGKFRTLEHKGGDVRNLVTEIDKGAEEMMFKKIRHHYPSHDLLGEESGDHHLDSEYKWIVDPLDGTTNFAHGLPIFCVSLGLEYRGRIEAGVVYNPMAEEFFTARRGEGAYLNGARLHVSATRRLIESLIVTGFPYDIQRNPFNAVQHFSNFLMKSGAIRRLGSAALDLCYVAAGRFDGFWEVSLNPWDMAAGVLLVEEAGGRFTDFAGSASNIYKIHMLATNGLIHDEMVEVLRIGNGEKGDTTVSKM